MAALMGGGAWLRLITLPLVLELLLLLLLFANAAEAKKTTITPAPSRLTAVPNDVETVYTIFCPAERPGCIVASSNDMPVTFTEGPGTLRTAYTISGTLTPTTTTTTSDGPAAAATTGTRTGDGNAGGAGGGGGNAAATGKGRPKKSGAKMAVGVEEVWKGGVVLMGIVAVLLW
ncbi:hypothetical protein F4815DRAFT_447878 [Daldinia loculata]|nr:hypothetical protein F4815DRAFT_447878 [Daldinia loculata]